MSFPGQHVYGSTNFVSGLSHHIFRSGYYDIVLGRDEFGQGATIQMMKHSDVKEAQPREVYGVGTDHMLKWKIGVPTCATYHIVYGHESCPFTGATFIQYGDDYRPLETAEVYTIIIVPNQLPHPF